MPAGLHLHLSNRLERLVGELAEVVGQPAESVLTPETIVVQSTGMSRWLSQELASRMGVCANITFPFPQKIVADLFAAALPDVPQSDAFSPGIMTWRIMRLLPTFVDDPAFESVRTYLAGEQTGIRCYQLATQISQLFDRYLAFRPEMILGWDAGREDDWQAVLWRALSSEAGGAHQPELGRRLSAKLRGKARLPAGLPGRLSVFGVSTLPPFYIDLLGAISGRIEVHLFLMQPTGYLWSHLLSPRQEAKLRRKGGPTPEALHFERGNALLTSMGDLGKHFLEAVAGLDPVTVSEPFRPPKVSTSLGVLQNDILELYVPEPSPAPAEDPGSIEIASCHSPTREVEALHDALLKRFDLDPELRPKDVLVMMPDIESYAPVIEAVFGTPESPSVEIPFSIADRGPRAASGVVDTFLRLLELGGSRLTASQILDVLESPAVLARFDLNESDLETITTWIRETRIRWGKDAAHRGTFDVPEFHQNSWRSGLDRLLLGYALPGQGTGMFGGILPFDDVEGSTAETLGSLVEFTTRLFATLEELETPRPLEGWRELLRAVLDRFFSSDDQTERELVQLRRALDSLADLREKSGFDEAVPLEILMDHLESALGDSIGQAGYLSGRVTFCALKPMRSIPFKVICLLGMDDTAFPRSQPTQDFDRMTRDPKPGDRSARADDRYLFLETILSAREALYISYVGQSARDNSQLPPSVVVSELLDYVQQRFEGPDHGIIQSKHRLQAFNPAYFGEGPLFSYSGENARAAAVSVAERKALPPFATGPVSEPEDEWRRIDLSQLIRFYRNPAEFFARRRLSIRLPDPGDSIDDREPFSVDPLTAYPIKQSILEDALAGTDPDVRLPMLEAEGVLPPGYSGQVAFEKLTASVQSLAHHVKENASLDARPPVSIEQSFGDWKLGGTVSRLTESGLVHFRAATLKAKDLLDLWIRLLAVNTITPTPGMLIAEDRIVRFDPVPDSLKLLGELIDLYRRGLREPLPFFPESSLALVQAEKKEDPDPLAKAEKKWRSGNDFSSDEADNAYFDLAFHHTDSPLDGEWEVVSRTVFAPLLDSSTEEKIKK